MNKSEIQEINRTVRREMGRHAIDGAEVQVSSNHGVVYLHGRVRPLRGHEDKFTEEVSAFLKALRQRSGVRDVIPEWVAAV